MKPFMLGEVLRDVFRVWGARFLPFTGVAFLLYTPVLAYYLLAHPDLMGEEILEYSWAMGLFTQLFLVPLLTGILTYGTIQKLRQRPGAMSDLFRVGVDRMLLVLGVSIVAGLAYVAGFICLIVPGLICLAIFYVAVPAAAVERTGVFRSLGRSNHLSSGYRWHIFALYVIVLLITVALSVPFGAILVAVMFIGDPGDMGAWVIPFSSSLFGILLVPLSAIPPAVAYHRLRFLKEGVGADELARIFE